MVSSAKRGANPRAGAKRGNPGKPATKPTLDRAIQAEIGDKLRAMYGELSDQPLPDKLVEILDKLGKPAG